MLTRPQRQVLATLALLLLTVAPTAYVVLSAWRVNRSGHVREVEVELGRQLGVQVTLEGVRYPTPGEVVYRGVTLRLEDGRKPSRLAEIARADVVRLYRDGDDLTLDAEGLRLRSEGPRAALAQVGSLLAKAGGGAFRRVSLTAKSCQVELGEGLAYDLRTVAGQVETKGDGQAPTLTASYYLPGDGQAAARCELTLRREQGRAALTFQTMDGPPPSARVLDPFFRADDWLGPKARVEGTLTLRQAGAADWEADYRGTLIDVDLAALVGRRFPDHRLTGLARVALETARWGERPGGQGAGWVDVRGTLTAGRGTIGAGLLRALATEMKFRLTRAVASDAGELEYHGLGLTFALSRDGEVGLAGALGAEFATGAVLARGDRVEALALAPEAAANVRGLWRTLFPASDNLLVPVSNASHLLNSLPLPPTVAAQAGAGRAN